MYFAWVLLYYTIACWNYFFIFIIRNLPTTLLIWHPGEKNWQKQAEIVQKIKNRIISQTKEDLTPFKGLKKFQQQSQTIHFFNLFPLFLLLLQVKLMWIITSDFCKEKWAERLGGGVEGSGTKQTNPAFCSIVSCWNYK